MREQESITYEQLIAGLLLKFKKLSSVDFSLLVEDYQKKTNMDITGLWYDSPNNLGKFIETLKNGTIQFRNGFSLDYPIEENHGTIKEILEKVAGNKVLEYMKNLDMEKIIEEKETILAMNKEKVINQANVLLISDIEEDYEELIKYGFKNVDYFKSIIRAEKYFEMHLEELEKYHIIIKGNQNVQHCCFEGGVELEDIIRKIRHYTHALVTYLFRYDFEDHIKLRADLCDERNRNSYDAEEQSYEEIYDRIVENVGINHTLEKFKLKDKKFVPIKDSINPNRIPLPTKKSDLKILFLNYFDIKKYEESLAKSLGLNITFKDDNNFSLGKNVKRHLGDYDIIIGSTNYSDNLLGMNKESTEQCKDTGRDLTLLVTYDKYDYHGMGGEIKLKYRFGGNLALDSERHQKEFRVLRKPVDFMEEEEIYKKDYEEDIAYIIGILSAAVNIYNDALEKNKKNKIQDLDLKTIEEFDEEYQTVEKNEEERKKTALLPIRNFDDMRYKITSYLDYKNKGFIKELPEGLIITNGKDGIRVENIYDGRIFSIVSFPKNDKKKNLRIFEIQTLSNKGKLSPKETIGLYTRKYETLESIPNRPNEQQEKALVALYKKVDYELTPLNDKAWNQKIELKNNKRLILKNNKIRNQDNSNKI